MKSKILNFLKIVIPLGLGLFLTWWMFSDISEEDKKEMLDSVASAKWGWLAISMCLAILSHASRAYRWRFTLEPLGYQPKFLNSFFSVMIGYMVNLLIPRAGELSRCGYMSKHEKIPFDKLLGTVVAERVADVIILLGLIVTVLIVQSDTILDFVLNLEGVQNLDPVRLGIMAGIALVVGVVALFFIWRSEIGFVVKIKSFLSGIFEGAKSILKMKKKWAFLFHTAAIWGLYLLMFQVTIYCIPGVEGLPFGGTVSAFVIGGIAIALTNGGIGTYPLFVMKILTLYGISENVGKTFGWLVWSTQTLMIIVVGLLSIILIAAYNRKRADHVTT